MELGSTNVIAPSQFPGPFQWISSFEKQKIKPIIRLPVVTNKRNNTKLFTPTKITIFEIEVAKQCQGTHRTRDKRKSIKRSSHWSLTINWNCHIKLLATSFGNIWIQLDQKAGQQQKHRDRFITGEAQITLRHTSNNLVGVRLGRWVCLISLFDPLLRSDQFVWSASLYHTCKSHSSSETFDTLLWSAYSYSVLYKIEELD